jgi:hypothetical protein
MDDSKQKHSTENGLKDMLEAMAEERKVTFMRPAPFGGQVGDFSKLEARIAAHHNDFGENLAEMAMGCTGCTQSPDKSTMEISQSAEEIESRRRYILGMLVDVLRSCDADDEWSGMFGDRVETLYRDMDNIFSLATKRELASMNTGFGSRCPTARTMEFFGANPFYPDIPAQKARTAEEQDALKAAMTQPPWTEPPALTKEQCEAISAELDLTSPAPYEAFGFDIVEDKVNPNANKVRCVKKMREDIYEFVAVATGDPSVKDPLGQRGYIRDDTAFVPIANYIDPQPEPMLDSNPALFSAMKKLKQ